LLAFSQELEGKLAIYAFHNTTTDTWRSILYKNDWGFTISWKINLIGD
jgi:hypothetical protein